MQVFETIGREVVASVIRGSSACVLAYGQSATGKTHTMMGTDMQPGLVPRLCRELALEDPLDVTIRYLKPYNNTGNRLKQCILINEASNGNTNS